MARPMREIVEGIQALRSQNRSIYRELEELTDILDGTMRTVILAHLLCPHQAKALHRAAIANDREIEKLSRELCGLDKK